jgi:hypothetical protein
MVYAVNWTNHHICADKQWVQAIHIIFLIATKNSQITPRSFYQPTVFRVQPGAPAHT